MTFFIFLKLILNPNGPNNDVVFRQVFIMNKVERAASISKKDEKKNDVKNKCRSPFTNSQTLCGIMIISSCTDRISNFKLNGRELQLHLINRLFTRLPLL